mgnify:FL=1
MRRSPPWALDLHRQLDALIARLPSDATGLVVVLEARGGCALKPKCTLYYRDDVGCADQLDSDPP